MPAPLAYLLATVALVALAWWLLVPPWQAPDEERHWSYVQSMAERLVPPGDVERSEQSTEQELAMSRSNAAAAAGNPGEEIEWSEEADRRFERTQAGLPATVRSDGGGSNPADVNPRLYYAYASLGYWAAGDGGVFDRLYAARAVSALLLLVTTAGAWLLAGEVFGRNRTLQLAAAAVTGLAPMITFVSASVNPDALLYALWSLALWLGARILRRGLSAVTAFSFLAVVGLAMLTKATTLLLLPGVVVVLALAVSRLVRRRTGWSAAATAGVGIVVALALPLGGFVAANQALENPSALTAGLSGSAAAPERPLSFFASYLWQFYLPKLPSQQEFAGFPALPVYDYWVKGAWGSFGAREVKLPEPVYLALALVSVGIAAAALVALVRARRRGHRDLALPIYLGVVALSLLAGLHYTEYRLLLSTGGPSSQGRYLLPLMPLAGVAAACALTLVPRPRRSEVLLGGLGVMLALQVLSLAAVANRFYA